MTLTASDLERRLDFLTASDVPAVLGVATPGARDALTIWHEKTQRQVVHTEPTPAMELGNALEPYLVRRAASEIGEPVEDTQVWCVHQNGWLAATLDGTLANGEIIEAKSSGLMWPTPRDGRWGEPGTDQVPESVMVQCQTQMACSGASVCWVPVMRSNGFTLYRIERSERLIDHILRICEPFWAAVKASALPDLEHYGASLKSLGQIERDPAQTADIDAGLLRQWFEADAAEKDAAKVHREAKALADSIKERLVASMGTALSGVCDAGFIVAKPVSVKGYTVEPKTYTRWVIKEDKK